MCYVTSLIFKLIWTEWSFSASNFLGVKVCYPRVNPCHTQIFQFVFSQGYPCLYRWQMFQGLMPLTYVADKQQFFLQWGLVRVKAGLKAQGPLTMELTDYLSKNFSHWQQEWNPRFQEQGKSTRKPIWTQLYIIQQDLGFFFHKIYCKNC